MTAPADVVLITRFNLPSVGLEEYIRAEDGWLNDRVRLFERFCLPSVRAQSVSEFHWLVYFDPQSPQWLRDRIHRWQDVVTPVYRAEVDAAGLLADLRRVSGATAPRLITANLDSDDALASDFVARLCAVEPAAAPCVIYLVSGLVLAGNLTYLRRDPVNAFCAVSTTWDAPATCWAGPHNTLGRIMPVQRVGGGPAWLQVVHGRNVSNRVRGKLVSPDPFRARFPGALDDARVPGLSQVIRDRLLFRPAREVRDGCRAGMRRGLVWALGQAKYDRLKAVGGRALLGRRVRSAAQGGPSDVHDAHTTARR